MEDGEKFEAQYDQPNDELSIVRNWFEAHKEELRIDDSGINFRTESQELILPFFEKEPDWNKFHIYEWPDGRKVYEVNLGNKEIVLTSEFTDNMPQADPSKTVIQNIMFVENRENGRYDPVISRYYPADEYSISGFEEISYNKIGAGWSGTVDIWTYDERYFVGFIIEDGQLIATKHPKGYDFDQNARKIGLNGENLDTTCRHVVTITTVVTIVSAGGGSHISYENETSVHMVCSGGSLGNNLESNGNTGTTYLFNSGGGGGSGGGTSAPNEQPYTPTKVVRPILINQLSNPCASELFKEVKKGGLISAVSKGGGEFSKNILDLLNASDKYNVIITNSNFEGNGRTKPRSFNETTGKFDIMIELSNDYLSKASQLSIVRTIIHESIHAYLLHEGYTSPSGTLHQGITRYAIGRNYTEGNQVHHEFMPQFIDAIAYSLWSWDMAYGSKGQIPLSYMKDLAWGGMTSYKDENGIIRYYDSFKERFPNSNDRNRIERNIKNESDGNWSAKGKKCS